MNWLNDMLQWLDKIQGLPAVALVLFTCIVIGYAFRFIKRFPNDGIPVVVILCGAVMMLFIADPRANNMPARVWTCRNIGVGLVIGMLAWMLHNIVLSKVEDFIASKFPSVGNTDFFKRNQKPDSPPDQGTEPKG